MADVVDPSRRYVLAADAPLVKNLAALWAVDPKLAALVEEIESGDATG